MQGTAVDHPADVVERVEALSLLGHRFAAEVDEAPIGAHAVGEEIESGVDEFGWLLKAPASVALSAKSLGRIDTPVLPH
jgi:hypothetical protein